MKTPYRRTHPISIFLYISRWLFLLLLPLLRGTLTALQGGVQSWLRTAWLDLLVLFLILAIGVCTWLMSQYRYDQEGIAYKKGIFWRSHYWIPFRQISSVALIENYYLRPFFAVHLRIDTPAGSVQNADFSLTLWKKDALALFSAAEAQAKPDSSPDFLSRRYRPKGVYVAVLSAFVSNSFAGILLASTFISQTGRLLGEEISDRIYGTLEQFARIMAFGIPPAAAAIAYLILGGWLLAFLTNLIRHKNFRVTRKEASLLVEGGIITRRSYSLVLSQINYMDIRQSVLTKILGIYTVFIHIAGFGKKKDDVSVLIPSARYSDMRQNLRLLLPEYRDAPRTLKPNLGAIMKFLNDALWPCLLIPGAAWLLIQLFPSWKDFIKYVGGMLCIPALWFLAVRIMDFLTSGLSRQGDTFTLRYSNFYHLHTIVVQQNRIATVCLRQSILQRGDGRCDVLLYTRSEGLKRHHLRNLDRQSCKELFGLDLDSAADETIEK